MNPTDLIIRTLDGELPPRVPTFLAGIEDRTFKEVLGKRQIPGTRYLLRKPLTWILNQWGPKASKILLHPILIDMMVARIKASSMLGFDSIWGILETTLTAIDGDRMVRYSGSKYQIREDGYGNLTYFYMEPCFHTREEYEQWKFWPRTEKLAAETYKFYKRMVEKYGSKTCICGQGPYYGLFESFLWAVGFANIARWIRKDTALIHDYVKRLEEITLACINAMIDAGIKIVLVTDDMGYKLGPLLQPEKVDEFFGAAYTRIIKQVHERDARFILHSCGDNTLNFPNFIKWGVDGTHALENTCNLNPGYVKKEFGNKITFIGGIGIDYLLSEKSKDEEIDVAVRDFIKIMAPGGRFIIGPTHSETSIPAAKLRVLISAVKKYGAYPL